MSCYFVLRPEYTVVHWPQLYDSNGYSSLECIHGLLCERNIIAKNPLKMFYQDDQGFENIDRYVYVSKC